MGHRLFVPEISAGQQHTLDAARSHYLTRVLRLKTGDTVTCFDGSGSEYEATVSGSAGKAAALTFGALIGHHGPPLPLHLALGWLKGRAMDTVTQKATELGITDLWPITAARSNVRINASRTTGRVAHWQKIAIHASEQSNRAFVPTVHEPTDLSSYLAATASLPKFILQPGSSPLNPDLPRQALALLVGPEGGWTEDELRHARAAGAVAWGLGDWILRAETAPLAALAGIRQLWGWR